MCDLYCDTTFSKSNIEDKFKCGSKTNSRIWAVYGLKYMCLDNFIYVKELYQCMNSDLSSPDAYIYDGKIPWNSFLKIIHKLNLTKSGVRIRFENDSIIDPKWKCFETDSSMEMYIHFQYFHTTTDYVLQRGCLKLFRHISFRRAGIPTLRVINLKDNVSLSEYNQVSENDQKYLKLLIDGCPRNWFDLNRHCYRISNTKVYKFKSLKLECSNSELKDLEFE
ncbi:unnamed protein product [Adineta ricciae]|uniref:Uncharacterized protein n=1 Tax=Adineta ricciae TaxID=249248 RepID=A0A815V4Y2_ADIRI|nr:unnamed protein product [Adineta ricciae]CAF1656212.1 unnamed protein product [Adineta ricciae]